MHGVLTKLSCCHEFSDFNIFLANFDGEKFSNYTYILQEVLQIKDCQLSSMLVLVLEHRCQSPSDQQSSDAVVVVVVVMVRHGQSVGRFHHRTDDEDDDCDHDDEAFVGDHFLLFLFCLEKGEKYSKMRKARVNW